MSFLGNILIHGFYFYMLYRISPERRTIRDGAIVGFIAGGLLLISGQTVANLANYLSNTLSDPILLILNSIYEEGCKITLIITYAYRFRNNNKHLRLFGVSMGISYAFMETIFYYESSIFRGVLPVLLHVVTCVIISDGVQNFNLDSKITWLLASYLFAVVFHTGYNAYVTLSWMRLLEKLEEWSSNFARYFGLCAMEPEHIIHGLR